MSLASKYRTVQVETASPPRLMMMLFDGAVRFMKKGDDALAASDHRGAIDALERASHIVIELDSTMKRDLAPELCEQLHELYQYVIGRLLVASTGFDRNAIEEAMRAFGPIVEGFREAVSKTPATVPGSAPARSAARP